MIIALSVNRPRGCCGVGSKLINKAIKQLAGAGRPNLDKTCS